MEEIWAFLQGDEETRQARRAFSRAGWALAALIAYTDLNDMTEFPIPARSATFRVAPETIRRRRDLIRESLRIEPFDPRYVSDAGLITMVLKI